MKRPYMDHTVEQMLDLYAEAVHEKLNTHIDAMSHGGHFFDRAHEARKEHDLLRNAIQLELLYRIDHKLDRLGSELRSEVR